MKKTSVISIKGARVHNLKNVSLDIPKDGLIVFTGLSGSGKSSLAFDTIYAEGQRRYVESLSAYARQFLEQLDKPDVDSLDGLSPAISIDQKNASKNPRSTVGTVTEIQDYLRLLYASIGTLHCPVSGRAVQKQSAQDMFNDIIHWEVGHPILLLAPLITNQKGEFAGLFGTLRRKGFVRVRVDGTIKRLEECGRLAKNKYHTIELVIDRMTNTPENHSRLFEAIELSLQQSNGLLCVECPETSQSIALSEHFVSDDHQFAITELTPRLFSFNSPVGACAECKGLGTVVWFDPANFFSDDNTLWDVLEHFVGRSNSIHDQFQYDAEQLGYNLDIEDMMGDLSDDAITFVLYGRYGKEIDIPPPSSRYKRSPRPRGWEGIINVLRRRLAHTDSDSTRENYRHYTSKKNCPTCQGQRLNIEALSVKINDYSIAQLGNLSIRAAREFIENLSLTPQQARISKEILKEIGNRLTFLDNVGLHYLTLNRAANTLSGGEHQRIRLATQIGSGLTGVLYVLDEPSIGLHQHDNQQLIATLKHLRDLGNTVIVVEHDEDTIREADHIVDIGPHAGIMGGHIIHNGSLATLLENDASLTGQYLSGKKKIAIPTTRRTGHDAPPLRLEGANKNNLKNATISFPLGTLTCITGVSGSGKSTLIQHTLLPSLSPHPAARTDYLEGCTAIFNHEIIDSVITIDQSAIGRTPRSNPATYVGIYTPIRELFAQTPTAKLHGFKPGRFSFNVRGGRCETCEGAGIIKIEMHFLTDIFVTCTTCKGHRFNDQTLSVQFKGHTISDVLTMTVNQAVDVFDAIPAIHNKLTVLQNVGLGYLKLGQSATTLSGGEAQRIKLAKELSKRNTGQTLYLLDEPTTGLHFEDIQSLLKVLQQLVDGGNTVLVIEHNLDIIKCADYVIDMGPGGGNEGGNVVVSGTPEVVARHPSSFTGRYLSPLLAGEPS